jgi:outer membrane protein OmpA-like peptidoglycan-associated protein
MSRPGTAPPSGAEQARSPARIALAVGLLVLGIGDLAFIGAVLLPLYHADDTYRWPTKSIVLPRSEASISPAMRRPAVVHALAPGIAAPIDGGEARGPDAGAARALAVVPAAPPSPAAVAGAAEAVPPEDFPDLLFAINTTWLSRASRETLDRVAEALARNPDRRVVLSGHTDGAGDPELNRALSRERAARASRYLRGRGVEPGRIEIRAFGAKQPVETTGPSEFRARNRRVEITVQ